MQYNRNLRYKRGYSQQYFELAHFYDLLRRLRKKPTFRYVFRGNLPKQISNKNAAHFLFYYAIVLLKYLFSNSLIIHEELKKEITTVKEVWICDPNYHKLLL